MTLVSDAMIFAACAHDGMLRKGTNVPYIVHPAEVAAIASTLTDDPEILAAAVLHDVIEDCGVSLRSASARAWRSWCSARRRSAAATRA